MRKLFFVLMFILPLTINAQSIQSLDTIKAPDLYENIFVKKIETDSLTSSFLIFIKKSVRKHKHVWHSEHVHILAGQGEMLLGEKVLLIKKGDIIFIPKNTVHSVKVTSKEPMKALSIQAPKFEGKDRVFVD